MITRKYVAPFGIALLVLVLAGAAEMLPNGQASAGPQVAGDVNCSGTVNAVDALQVLRSVAGLSTNAECMEAAGNVDCNGSLNSVDALKILRYVAAMPNQYPEGCTPIGEPVCDGVCGATVTVTWEADVNIELFVLPGPASNMQGVSDQYGLPGWDAALKHECVEPPQGVAVIDGVTADSHYIAVVLATPCENGPWEAPFTITIEYADGSVETESETLWWGGTGDFLSYGPYDFAPAE
jgi:hypothetical protein